MAERVKIPAASAEVIARFDRPYIGLLTSDKAKVLEGLLVGLLPFKARLANTEIIDSAKPSEDKVILRLPEHGLTFQFGAEEYRFSKDGASWATAEQDGKIWQVAESAVLESSGAKIVSFTITLAMHLQVLSMPREIVLAPFLAPPFQQLLVEREAQTHGCHVRFVDGGDVLIDYSLAYANGIFVRLSAQFEGKAPIADMFARLRADEERILEILDIEQEAEATE
jgi:hypothetical protein